MGGFTIKYYELHNEWYADLEKKGAIAWGGEKYVENLLNHEINERLEVFVEKYFSKLKGKALDLGTGTGTCALYLSSLGFKTTGIDVSENAIRIANQNKTKLNLEVEFKVDDICNLDVDAKFDLITDSSFLHCLVGDDRKSFFKFAKKSLDESGYLFLHSMVQSNDMSEFLGKTHLKLVGETLWSTRKNTWDVDWKIIDGKEYFVHRHIPTQSDLKEEIISYGFSVIEEIVYDTEKGCPNAYVCWLNHDNL